MLNRTKKKSVLVMTDSEAIEKAIVKWTMIKNSDLKLRKGLGQCALCDIYLIRTKYDKCEGCPLQTINAGCLVKGSNWMVWSKIPDIFSPYYLNQTKQKQKNKLYKCILTMLNNLFRAKAYIITKGTENGQK